MRGLTGLCLVALLATATAIAGVLSDARDGIDDIGHRDAPQAVRTADLYFALSDMDAQVANLLLLGADPGYATQRQQTLETYDQRRTQADGDLQKAAEASADDPNGQRAVQTVLDQLGQYEALVARARLLEDQAHAPAGQPSADALAAYRQATDLLRQQLLPAADQVTAASAATVDRTYTAQRSAITGGWWWILITMALALAALVLLQRLLSVRFHRIINPPLAAVTLLAVLAAAAGLTLASGAEDHLIVAKSNAYDSVIALSRARAVAYDMNADESRYLTDPARAAAYQQSFLDKSQSIARLDGATIDTYDAKLAQAADQHRADHRTVPFGGYLGTELDNITFPGEQDAAERLLTTFQQYEKDDRTIRSLRNQGKLKDAVTFDTGTAAGQSDADFAQLSHALDDVLAINQHALGQAVTDADDDLGLGVALTGGLTLAAALALTVLGVRPRLREFR
ncbi:hypothetical protein E6W39_12100 [Kitasatospora acidiphila]|uniref:Secreted protein n=1 Tax=Kitasatospora acidiphila TaxID=2567942 RepID=A0A540W1H1_9ACTN|nr:hypothetical protein [Kitasatospora acidiphila]TQF02866.1 hypothetical protein E6W39_12100 [Kitasatospora acidiphila]